MKGMKAILCILTVLVALQLLCENLVDIVNEAELYIERTYKGERARKIAGEKLDKILDDQQKTDKEKIDEIQREFLRPKKEDEINITEANAYRLIWTPPLSWDIHSITIAYNVEQSRTQVISAETVDSKKTNRMTSNENGDKTVVGDTASFSLTAGLSYQTKISLASLLMARPHFMAEANASCKANWDESKTELWSKSRQEQLASSFEELTKDIRSTQVSRCHLTFAIDFHNNCDEDLLFSASSTVPVYKRRTLVLNAVPENIGNSQMFTIPRRMTTTIKFRGEIDTTQAYKLLEFMKTNAPTILPERGQLVIYSLNGKVKNAIQESLAVAHFVIRCGEYEWKVRNAWNDRRVTLREALWAINALYDKGPFDIEGDECVSMFGKFRCGPYPAMAEVEAYPVVEMNGSFVSHFGKEQLNGRLPDKDMRFYMGSIYSYVNSEEYSHKFYKCLLDDLLSMTEKDEKGEVKWLLGRMFAKGKGTSKNLSDAVKWYSKAAEQGNDHAQFDLGLCYEIGEGIEKNTTEAVKWFREAAKQGNTEALSRLGLYKNDEKVPKMDMSETVNLYRMEAEREGKADAQYNLGWCYYNGKGVSIDMYEAVKWFRKAAEQGNAKAQCNLGECYYFGNGIEKNSLEAVKWFHKAAERGNTDAQRWIGWCYEIGEGGIPLNITEAVKWYSLAAEQGNPKAQLNLGDCYFYAKGVSMNTYEAVEWYREAAEQGYASAQYTLGWCYEIGAGVETNVYEAIKWYRKAADQGDDGAIARLKELNQ